MKPSDEVLLLTPGPTPIHRRAAAAMQWPMRGHMDPEVFAFNDRVVADLHRLFGTAQGAFTALMAGTGSLGMEAGLANLLEPGDPVLIKRVACFLNGVQDSSKDSRQAKKAGQYGKSRIPSRAGGVSNPSQQRIPA